MVDQVEPGSARWIGPKYNFPMQINAFLVSGGKIKRNFKTLLMKATKSLDGRARGRILSSINKRLSGSQSVVARDRFVWTQPV